SLALSSRTIVKVPFEGYYFLVTYLLTGETRKTYSEAVVPLQPFDPVHLLASPGAWELVLRYSSLDVGSAVFAPWTARLADTTRNAREASEFTIVFNWYLNAWVRTQINWEHASFATPVLLAPAPFGFQRGQDTILARLQVIF